MHCFEESIQISKDFKITTLIFICPKKWLAELHYHHRLAPLFGPMALDNPLFCMVLKLFHTGFWWMQI